MPVPLRGIVVDEAHDAVGGVRVVDEESPELPSSVASPVDQYRLLLRGTIAAQCVTPEGPEREPGAQGEHEGQEGDRDEDASRLSRSAEQGTAEADDQRHAADNKGDQPRLEEAADPGHAAVELERGACEQVQAGGNSYVRQGERPLSG